MRSGIGQAAALLVAALVAAAIAPAAAHAGSHAYPPYCHLETLVGSASGGTPEVRIATRNLFDQPLVGQLVWLDLSSTSLVLFTTQDAGVTVDCAARRLGKVSNSAGEAVFHPRFGGSWTSETIRVYSDGIQMGTVQARSTDLDGVGGGTGLADFAAFSAVFLSTTPHPEINFDRSASDVPDLADFAIFATELKSAVTREICP